jgi:hypothetical protein
VNARQAAATAIDAIYTLILTALILATTAIAMAITTIDRDVHTPPVSQPAGGTSYATTHVGGTP